MSTTIKKFDKINIAPKIKNSYFDLIRGIWEEIHPDEPLPTIESMEQHFFDPIPNKDVHSFLLFNNDDLIGSADLLVEAEESPFYNERKQLGQYWINVAKDHRRRGFGTLLLQKITSNAEKLGIKTLELTGATPLQESIAFCEKYGGVINNESIENRAYIENIDWDVVESWYVEGVRYYDTQKIETVLCDSLPDGLIDDFARLYTEIQYQCSYDEVKPEERITSERIRKFEDRLQKDKIRWIHLIARRNEQIVAFVDLRYHLDALERVTELTSFVNDDFIDDQFLKGLRAQILKHIREELPRVVKILILDEKPYMIKSNEDIGFSKHSQGKSYTFLVSNLRDILGE
ncbi:MAG: GNAT family N-acetyltransferase [Candidatus Heimdallarchaeota archaeon]|nr:GNAT family N-acetyltransferase [Candidatus Heimdallarchaeota archaeon]